MSSVTSRNGSRRAAAIAVVAGVTLFCDLAFHPFEAWGRWYFPLAGAVTLGLLGVPWALWSGRYLGPGRHRALAVAGTVLVGLGATLWPLAFTLLFREPEAAFSQRLTPAGSSSMALGMVLLGVAVLTSGVLRGARRVTPLLVGVYFPAQLAVQLTFFLGGKDGEAGPDGVLLGTWGLLWAACGYALATAPGRGEPETTPDRGWKHERAVSVQGRGWTEGRG